MWNYEKRLQYPINIKTPNAKIAQVIMSQYGGPQCFFSKLQPVKITKNEQKTSSIPSFTM